MRLIWVIITNNFCRSQCVKMASHRKVLFPVILLCNVFGTLPVTYKLNFSRVLLLANVVVNFYVSWNFSKKLIDGYKYLHLYSSDMIMTYIIKFVYVLGSGVNIYFIFARNKSFSKIITSFDEMQKFVRKSEVDRVKFKLRVLFVCLIGSSYALYAIEILTNPQLSSAISYTVARIDSIISISSLHSVGLQFLSLCLLLNSFLRQINLELNFLLEEHKRGVSNAILINKIEDLRMRHNKLCELAALINSTYGFSLFSPICFSSIFLQTDIFTVIKKFVDVIFESPLFHRPDPLINNLWFIVDVFKLTPYFSVPYLVYKQV